MIIKLLLYEDLKIFHLFLKSLFLLTYMYLLFFKINKKIIKIKVCICTIGKLENQYIREFVEYYKKLGVDKIYIYDNNEINGELFETVLFDYISTQFVEIINYRGYIKSQYKMMNNCYKKNYLKYDWIMFYDIDEFLYLKNYYNIKNYLNKYKFNKCKIIYLNFIYYTDNNNLYYENKTLLNRFRHYKMYRIYFGKSIIRGNIPEINITSCHYLTKKIKPCNGFGKFSDKFIKFNSDDKYYYIKHYSFKSTEEYCRKINKGNAVYGNSMKKKINKIKMYFKYNEITIEKINLFENETGINLDFFRNKLKMKEAKL